MGPGDTVVLASPLIPGNENAVNRVINGLTGTGARVVHKGNAMVQCPATPPPVNCYLYNMVKPANVMPVHGEVRHPCQCRLAVKTGVDPQQVIIAATARSSTWWTARPRSWVRSRAATSTWTEPAWGHHRGSLKDRRILGEEGSSRWWSWWTTSRRRSWLARRSTRGVRGPDAVFDEVIPTIEAKLIAAIKDGVTDQHALAQIVRRTLGRWVNAQHRRRPMIVPVVIEG